MAPKSIDAILAGRKKTVSPRTTLGKRQYTERMAEVFTLLGNKCKQCGKGPEDGVTLHVDHLFKRTWVSRQLNRWQRAKRYLEEAKAGKVQALCGDCNRRKGEPKETDPEEKQGSGCPF